MFKKISIILSFILFTVHAQAKMNQSFEELFFYNFKMETVDILHAVNLSNQDKVDRLSKTIEENLAVLQVGRSVLGQPWRKLTKPEKREYIQIFSKWVGITISKRLVGFEIKKDLIVKKIYKGQNNIVVIRTTTANVIAGGEVILDWYIKSIKGEPKLIDVAVGNVSMVSTQRAEFTAVYGNKGLKGLISQMKLQIDGK